MEEEKTLTIDDEIVLTETEEEELSNGRGEDNE